MANARAYAVASAGIGRRRVHGDLVGERRERREDARAAHHDAGAVSPTLWSVTWLPTMRGSVTLSIVGWMIVWVSDRSSRASRRWKRTRFSAPSAFAPDPEPAQTPLRAAKQANFTFM